MNVRYDLRDPLILRWVMDHPGREEPYSTRELAREVGLSHHSLIGHLLTGERTSCPAEVALRIAEVVGVAVAVLFAPPVSPETNGTSLDQQPASYATPQPPPPGAPT